MTGLILPCEFCMEGGVIVEHSVKRPKVYSLSAVKPGFQRTLWNRLGMEKAQEGKLEEGKDTEPASEKAVFSASFQLSIVDPR